MRNKIIFTLSILGVLAGLVAAFLFGMERKATPPVFQPIGNPYASAIYANAGKPSMSSRKCPARSGR
jgi:HlyD family secretion protein